MADKIIDKIKELRASSKKRKFPQSVDLILSLKEFDTKKPENKFSEDFFLPKGRGQDANVVVFAESAKSLDARVITMSEVDELAKNKREAKKLAAKTDFFLAEAKMMPIIGKSFGQSLAPRGKMPRILAGNEKEIVSNYRKAVKIKIKDSPVIQLQIGNENMSDEDILENLEAVLKFVENKLGRGKIGRVLIKTTMSKPLRIEAI